MDRVSVSESATQGQLSAPVPARLSNTLVVAGPTKTVAMINELSVIVVKNPSRTQ
jgi:hypothetical protein